MAVFISSDGFAGAACAGAFAQMGAGAPLEIIYPWELEGIRRLENQQGGRATLREAVFRSRKVVLKPAAESEIEAHRLMNSVGVGPRLVGVATVDDTTCLVIDSIPTPNIIVKRLTSLADFKRRLAGSGVKANSQTIDDIRKTYEVLQAHSIIWGDPQFLITADGHAVAIDFGFDVHVDAAKYKFNDTNRDAFIELIQKAR